MSFLSSIRRSPANRTQSATLESPAACKFQNAKIEKVKTRNEVNLTSDKYGVLGGGEHL
jgi:hypothetical protein